MMSTASVGDGCDEGARGVDDPVFRAWPSTWSVEWAGEVSATSSARWAAAQSRRRGRAWGWRAIREPKIREDDS